MTTRGSSFVVASVADGDGVLFCQVVSDAPPVAEPVGPGRITLTVMERWDASRVARHALGKRILSTLEGRSLVKVIRPPASSTAGLRFVSYGGAVPVDVEPADGDIPTSIAYAYTSREVLP